MPPGLPEALDHSSHVASIAAANLFSWAYDGPALVTAPAPSGINTLPAFGMMGRFLHQLGILRQLFLSFF